MGFLGEFDKLNINSSDDEIIRFIKQASTSEIVVTTEKQALYVSYALGLLNLKRQQKLIEEQRKGNKELVFATWALAIGTILATVLPHYL